MPVVAILFLLYGFYGNHLPPPWQHQGYDSIRMIPHISIGLDGIFGTAVDVSATLIILFTIYGAILQASGAGKFFVDFSFAATGGKAASAGRTVVLSSFLLGGPSGSGVATTVTLGTVAWPMLERAGYERNAAGGLLAAGGLGAIISPPVLGAAAFLIAEFLKISYLEVLKMAVIPTCLYYLSLFLMVEIDTRKYHSAAVEVRLNQTAWQLARRFWFHFLSLVAIIGFMVWGFSPLMSACLKSASSCSLMPGQTRYSLSRSLVERFFSILNFTIFRTPSPRPLSKPRVYGSRCSMYMRPVAWT